MTSERTALPGEPLPARPSPVGRLGTIVVIAVAAAAILAVSVLANGGTADPALAGGVTEVTLSGSAQGDAPVVGKLAPDFSAEAADGTMVQLSAFAGKPVWVTFGASWCQPCRAENPDVVAAYERHRANGLVVIQVYMGEDAAAVTDYATRVGIPYVKVPDPAERLANDYRILGIPTHYFIDRDGTLVSMKIGSLSPDAMDAALAEIGA